MTLAEYKKKVEDELLRHFLITIGDCTSDEAIEQAWKDNENVEEFIDWIGEKYDLTDYVKEPWLR